MLMKNHPQNISNKTKRIDNNLQTKKKSSFSQNEVSNETRKKSNASPQKTNEVKKEIKHDKNNIQNNQQISDNNNKITNNIIKPGNIIQTNNYINIINNKKVEDIKDKQDKKKIENTNNQPISKDNNNINSINLISMNDNKENNNPKKTNKINTINIQNNIKPKNELKEIIENRYPSASPSPSLQPPSSIQNDENFYNQLKENDKKLRDNLQAYSNMYKKSDGASLNTLFKLRSILINWLKDSDQELEYTKFITEKKLKYLMKNKEKSEARIKVLDTEIKAINTRKEELEKILGEIYCFYDEEGLKEDIQRFENSNEVKSGKFSKTLEQLETMKKMLPYVSEYGKIKENKTKKYNEKKELEKIVKSSGQTLVFLNNYYKNIKKKINEQINNNNI